MVLNMLELAQAATRLAELAHAAVDNPGYEERVREAFERVKEAMGDR